MFNAVSAAENIKNEFIDYISTLFNISDKNYYEQFVSELRKAGTVSKGPYLDISSSYKTGKNLETLIAEGEASPLFRELEGNIPDNEKEIQINRKLYLHQEQALKKANKGHNLIVTTGTGSGKTECFIIPIINHLLREAENNTLGSGVRAIVIYPMNALANDQMKRLRNLLKNYPDITFGVYNSSTKANREDGITEYGKIYKNDDGTPAKPLKNEIISRNDMQENPPHILITNYAMLEYMMLRPKDDAVFSGAKLRFIVLDEAHIYRGTTGMETSMLLKRLKARISNPANVMHILTSATLGGKESDADIVKFADTLCSAEFKADDIIRSQEVEISYDKEAEDIPLSLFAELADPKKTMNEIAADYGITIPENQPDSEFLYDLCINSKAYREIRKAVSKPMTVSEIKSNTACNITEQDIVNIINIASKAEKNKSALIKARYHMFAKALEGCYITIGKYKKLMLERQQFIMNNDEEFKVFECALCDDCGKIAVTGKENRGHLEFANRHDPDSEFYLLCDKNDTDFDIDEEDENDMLIEENDYIICSECGAIIHKSLESEISCSCGSEKHVKVRRISKKNSYGHGKCPACSMGYLKTFYLGYDAATAVLGTSLFEELPESEKILKSKIKTDENKKNLFMRKKSSADVETVKRKKQFLSFSDSRSEAAYFATYMEKYYKEFLRRRGIWHVVQENKEDMSKRPWEIKDFVKELTNYFDDNRTFAEAGEKGNENLTSESRKNAWIAVLNEMVNSRRSTSLVSMGLIKFEYKGNNIDDMEGVAEEYNCSAEDVKALFDLLVMDIVNHGAFTLKGYCSLNDAEKEYIFFTSVQRTVRLCKNTENDKKKTNVLSWLPVKNMNSRIKRVMKVLELNEENALELLRIYWKYILLESDDRLEAYENGEYFFSPNKFTIRAVNDDVPLYRCNVCRKVSNINCKNMCTSLRCTGHLERITADELIKNNHYAKLYSSELMKPLHIKEHTAQLGREEQQKYQEMFVNKDINALSCSTTFEMGVDVGDLETVYLRNMPPSPANYVQRAGRAGRGKNAAAFSLAYSKLSSHDFTYYRNPENMITGKIGVPLFTVKNEKVILRHIFAVALSSFFAQNSDVYNYNDADIFLNGDGWERLCDYLNEKPSALMKIIKESIPEDMHEAMGVNDYSWLDKLIGENGVLKTAVDEFRNTSEYYRKAYEQAMSEGKANAAAEMQKKLYLHKERNELIEFLARNNILPKYGFPIDTVELYQNTGVKSEKDLQMTRDLQMAISEYAPGSQVIADGKMYTSRYIRKLMQKNNKSWETVYIAQCGNSSCQTWNYRTVRPTEDDEKCISCNEILRSWSQAIEPRNGFIAEADTEDVPMHKPDKMYHSDDCYIGDVQRKVINKYGFSADNGYKFTMETSLNDSLMIVCNEAFYVCPNCGYSVGASKLKNEKNFNPVLKKYSEKHYTPRGKKCEVMLEKNKLCHVFKTDVVRLTFYNEEAGNYETMLSVMYAMLEAMSDVLDIERNDIKGCLHKISYGNNMIYSIVLYDAVSGGAGHVRRLVTENADKFRKVSDRAILLTKGCTCSPSCYSCLRNYYNQKMHDKLNREYAYKFLELYSGNLERNDDIMQEIIGNE